jgi:hypothetical protein
VGHGKLGQQILPLGVAISIGIPVP